MSATGALPGCLVKIYALREEVVAWVAGYFAWVFLIVQLVGTFKLEVERLPPVDL